MALWNSVGQVANIAQLTGVDAYGLISMIVEAAKTVKRNQETCQLLARRVRMIGDLIQQLQSSQLMQHIETRNPMEQLEETLRHAYMLIASCQDSSYLHSCFMGGKHAEQLREVQDEITFYLQLFPLVGFIDTTRNLERLMNRDRPSSSESEVTADGLDNLHHSDSDDRLRTKDVEAIKCNPSLKSEGKRTEGPIMDMGELANLIGGGNATEISYFSFSQILDATNNLSVTNLLGIGGFGSVFKGKLPSGHDIAVKRHSKTSFEGPEQFRTEIEAIPNLRHKNIISLIGCCIEGGEKILVYEYMPNKSLASVISDGRKKFLKWSKRLQIIKGVADGLAYLHGHSHMSIVHRDIKSTNILLDHGMNAKISDFGLAIMLAPNTSAQMTIVGTYGYAAPDYLATGEISEKTDVYSFGVVLLEIISGKPLCWYKRKADGTYLSVLLPDYARKHCEKAQKLVDPLLAAEGHGRAQVMECIKVALMCIHSLPENRPAMSEVVTMLDSIQAM